MNKVELIGNNVRTIEKNVSQKEGQTFASTHFTLAVNYGKEEANFIKCVAFGKTAESLASYVKAGDKIGIVGRLQVQSYVAKDGTRREITEVIVEDFDLLTPKAKSGESLGVAPND